MRRRRSVKGLKELKRNSVIVGRRVDTAVAIGGRAAAESVADEARRLVPVDKGDLHDSIGVESIGDQRFMGRSEFAVVVDSPHAGFVELGTSKMAAQPYLSPAVAGQTPIVRQVIARAVKSAIQRTITRR